MKRLALAAICFIFLCLNIGGCGGNSGTGNDSSGDNTVSNGGQGLRMGLLQFYPRHNIQNDACLPDDCFLMMEEETDTESWLGELSTVSNMAVLHWDRAIPWLAFDENPPQGVSHSEFFDGRIDDTLRKWINAFAAHFEVMPSGYLAVSILNGQRTGLQPFRVDDTRTVEVTDACPVLAPGTQVEFYYDFGSGETTASFDLERSYTNFVMYLYEKLQPEYLALMVEVNWFKEISASCSENWYGLVQLYRQIYDVMRPHVDSRTKVFATVAFQPLLDYDFETCHGPIAFEPCTGDPALPAYSGPDSEACYPLDLSAIDDLDQGDRLELLALSFYPDALLMDVGDDNLLELFPEEWDGVSECELRILTTPFLDPVAALDRFDWTKPIAIAELGARSNRTVQFVDGWLSMPPADPTSQAFWLDHFLTAAKERHFEFYVQSFLYDYEAIGPWTVDVGLLDADIYSLFNNFAYMGIYDAQGLPKDGVTETWLRFL